MSRPLQALSLAWLLSGCSGDEIPETKDAIPVINTQDADGDGFKSFIDGGQDCDDNDASIYPGAIEECDGIDQDCDREPDNGVQAIYFLDNDGDGYGDDETRGVACEAPAGSVPDGGDCDDNDATRNPGLPELCNGIDDDCDDDTPEVAVIGGNSYATVADAIGSAQEGARIELCDGVHELAGVQVNRSMTIASASGDPTLTALEGDGNRALLIVLDGELTLENITVMHGGGSGTATVYGGAAMGGAINAINAPLRIENCIFEENRAEIGGAIAAIDLTVNNSIFRSNIADNINGLGWGGAIYLARYGLAEINGSTFEFNQAAYGGGMLTSGTVTITNSLFTQNTVGASAGGVYALSGSLSLFDTTISDNTTTFAGGVMLDGAVGDADENTSIINNTASRMGGGLLLYGTADVTWTGGVIQGNASDLGGGIFIDRDTPAYYGIPGSVQLSEVHVEGNTSLLTSVSAGGGIFAVGSPITITNSAVIGNEGSLGGGISVNNTTPDAPMTLTGLQIVDNRGDRGAGVDLVTAQANLTECSLSGNIAGLGGGLHLGAGSSMELASITFSDDPNENLPEDVFLTSGAAVMSYDYDGSTSVKCDSIVPQCE